MYVFGAYPLAFGMFVLHFHSAFVNSVRRLSFSLDSFARHFSTVPVGVNALLQHSCLADALFGDS